MTDTNTNTAPASAPQSNTPEMIIQVGRESLVHQFESPKPGPQPKTQEAAPQKEEAPKAEEPKEELILGKFKSREDLEAAYKELERKLGQPKTEEPKKDEPKPAAQEEAPKAEEPAKKPEGEEGEAPKQEENGEEVKDAKGQTIDVSKYENEFLSNSTLSEESYKELAEKHGIPKDVVDDVIQLRVERAERVKQEFFKAAGGEDNLKTLLEWASASDTDPAIAAAYNKAIDAAKTQEDAILAIQGLRSRYESIKGVQPRRIVGEDSSSLNTNGGDNGSAYASEADFQKDRRTERFAKDPVYRQRVMDKLGRSSWFQAEQAGR